MEGDPHSVIEGIVIGAWAVGAHEGFVYVRDEYPLAVVNLTVAIEQARRHGFLGQGHPRHRLRLRHHDLAGRRRLRLRRVVGADALARGEGRRAAAEVRARHRQGPVRPARRCSTTSRPGPTSGAILLHGADWFAGMGTEKSKGTKAFSLVGKVKNTGLIELPMGMTLRDIVYGIGGGIIDDRPFKAVQTGGPSGGCVPESLLDLPVDYERLTDAGSMMGSGGMIVMDDRTCMVDVARYFLQLPHRGVVRQVRAVPRGPQADARDLRRPDRRARQGPATSSASRRWRRPCSSARCASWASRRRTRCCPPCGTSARSTRRTSSRGRARPGCAAT